MIATTTHTRDCICDPCIGHRRERKRYRIEHERGLRRMTSAAQARNHLLWLAEQGAGRRTVAKATGISELTLVHIGNGRRLQVMRSTEAKILAFQPEDAALVPNCRTIDATPTRLRIQALVALGYTQAFIAQSIGRAQGELDLHDRVYRRRALAVLDLCKKIGDAPGPSGKAAVQARNKGWRTPADYDEELFYDPHWDGTEPTPEAVGKAEANLREHDFLASCGHDIKVIAERLGVTQGYLEVLIRRRRREEACRTATTVRELQHA